MPITLVYNPGATAVSPILQPIALFTWRGKKGAGAISKGDLCIIDTALTPDGWKQSPAVATPAYAPFAVCQADVTSAATELSLGTGGIQAITAGGTIEIGQPVMADTATAGRVIAFSAT